MIFCRTTSNNKWHQPFSSASAAGATKAAVAASDLRRDATKSPKRIGSWLMLTSHCWKSLKAAQKNMPPELLAQWLLQAKADWKTGQLLQSLSWFVMLLYAISLLPSAILSTMVLDWYLKRHPITIYNSYNLHLSFLYIFINIYIYIYIADSFGIQEAQLVQCRTGRTVNICIYIYIYRSFRYIPLLSSSPAIETRSPGRRHRLRRWLRRLGRLRGLRRRRWCQAKCHGFSLTTVMAEPAEIEQVRTL